MGLPRGLLLLGLPIAALGLLATAILMRGGSPTVQSRSNQRPKTESAPLTPLLVAPSPSAPRRPASDDRIARAATDAHVESTYQNLRIAVASGNEAVQKALLDVLGPSRGAAARLAETQLATARSQTDRDITLQTLEVLKR